VNQVLSPARAARPAADSPAHPPRWQTGTWPWLLAALSLVFAKTVMYSRSLTVDGYYDLYAGRYVAQHGIPRVNVVTVAAHGSPWIDQQWLAQILYYWAWRAGGYPALAAFSVVLVTSAFAVLALMLLRRGVAPPRVFAWTAAAFAAGLGDTFIRAQSFAYPCFALTLWLLLEDDRSPRPRAQTWLLAPLLVFWANTHGSVLLGAALVVLYAGYRVAKALARRDARALWAYLGLGVAAAAAVLCTPYGTGVARYYHSVIGNPVLPRYVLEWATPNPLYPGSWAFFALVITAATVTVIMWRRGTRPDPLLAAITLVLLAAALTAIRNQAWFGFAASLLAADTLARGGGQAAVFGNAFRRLIAGALCGLAVASLTVLALAPSRDFETLIPRQAIDVAAAVAAKNPGVRILGDEWSSSAMLWLHPAMSGRVGFDARLEQYSGTELSGYLTFLHAAGPGWQRVMRGYGIVVVSRLERPQLAASLQRLPGWRIVYRDRDGIVLERRAGT
jgi:hypothetical protein